MMEHDDEDEHDEGEGTELEPYIVDDETRNLIEAACNCIVSLAEAQIDEQSRHNLMVIADALALRFALESMELEEQIHTTEEGEEIIYRPKGGSIWPEQPEEGEAPAAQA